MNKDVIHKAIEDPELLSQLGVDDLQKISEQYPYFSAAQVLLTKAYQRRNDHRYTDQLHHAAVYAGDRRLFYDWIKKPGSIIESVPEKTAAEEAKPSVEARIEPTIAEVVETEQLIHPSADKLADLILDDEEKTDQLKKSGSDRIAAVAAASIAEYREPLQPQAESVGDPHPAPEVHPKELGHMDREVLLEALKSSIELEVGEDVAAQQVAEGNDLSELKDPMNPEDSYAAWMYKRSRQVHFNEDEASAAKRPADEEPMAISDWTRPEKQEAAAELEEKETEHIPGIENTRLSHGIRRMTGSDSKSHQQQLIDRFIRMDPNITRGKVSDYSSGNIAKDSLEEDISLITETMAQLFVRQGKLDKARKAYKKLMELHPEKSIYFAAQLKNLDKLKKH